MLLLTQVIQILSQIKPILQAKIDNLDILVTSKNYDRNIMQLIRTTNEALMNMQQWNYFSQFR